MQSTCSQRQCPYEKIIPLWSSDKIFFLTPPALVGTLTHIAPHNYAVIDSNPNHTDDNSFANRANMSSASSVVEKGRLEKDQRLTTEEQTISSTSEVQDAAQPLEKVATDLPHAMSKVASAAASSVLHRVDTRPDGSDYPNGLKLGLITLALCLGVFLMALDNSIIATAIPHITDQFNSLDDVGWYGSGK